MSDAGCGSCGHNKATHGAGGDCLHVTGHEYDCRCNRFRYADDPDVLAIAELKRKLAELQASAQTNAERWGCDFDDAYETMMAAQDRVTVLEAALAPFNIQVDDWAGVKGGGMSTLVIYRDEIEAVHAALGKNR